MAMSKNPFNLHRRQISSILAFTLAGILLGFVSMALIQSQVAVSGQLQYQIQIRIHGTVVEEEIGMAEQVSETLDERRGRLERRAYCRIGGTAAILGGLLGAGIGYLGSRYRHREPAIAIDA